MDTQTKKRARTLSERARRANVGREATLPTRVASQMLRALEPEVNQAIVRALKTIGYKYVSLDLQGYRTGSLNEVLRLIPA